MPDRSAVVPAEPPIASPTPRGPARSRTAFVLWGVLLGLAALIGLGVAVWEAVEYRFVPKRFGVVVPGEVYRSGQISRWQFEPTIEKHDIDVVIDLNGVEPTDEDQAAEIASYETLGLEHHRFKLRGDGTGEVGHYVDAVAKLAECRRDGKTVLVHCHAGTQRTGSVVAAYRVLVLKQPPQEAYAELARYGWNAKTDQILLTYLNANLGRVAEELARRGLIDRVPAPLPVVGP